MDIYIYNSFPSTSGVEHRAIVEMAPHQKIPRKSRTDKLCGTYDKGK